MQDEAVHECTQSAAYTDASADVDIVTDISIWRDSWALNAVRHCTMSLLSSFSIFQPPAGPKILPTLLKMLSVDPPDGSQGQEM